MGIYMKVVLSINVGVSSQQKVLATDRMLPLGLGTLSAFCIWPQLVTASESFKYGFPSPPPFI